MARTAKQQARKSTAGATAGGYAMQVVPLEDLVPHPDNDYRVDEKELDDLVDSIRREGLGQLPLVRPLDAGFQIIAGHRRVEAYKRLRGEDELAYGTIPVNVMDDCDDERALILLDATNLMTRTLTPLERAKKFQRIGKLVPELRRRDPSLRGVRTNQVIADIITNETGQSVSEATVKRAIAAGKRSDDVKQLVDEYGDQLISEWQVEVQKDGFKPSLVKELACREGSVQRDLFMDYQREELTPSQVAKRLEVQSTKTDADAERVLDRMIDDARQLSSMQKKDGVLLDSHRLAYLKKLLGKL